MIKKVLVIIVFAFLLGIFGAITSDYVFAEGINPHGPGYITSTKDTTGLLAVEVTDYTKMKFFFYILDPDTLRTDTLRLSLQHSDSPWTGYTSFLSDVITQLDNVACTLSRELTTDTLFLYGVKNYIRWYAVFGDSAAYVDSEAVRVDADGTPEDWTRSTGADSYALVDEAAIDTSDYISATAINKYTVVTAGDHAKREITVDSVKMFVVPKYYLVGSETILPDADISSQWLSTDAGDVLYTEIDEAASDDADYMYIEDVDSLAVIGFADQGSAGTATIDSVVTSYLVEYGTALCSLEAAVCVTDAAGCDTCDCSALDTLVLTADSVRHSFPLATSPRGSAWTSDEVDSLTAMFRTIHVAANGTSYVIQAESEIYYSESASFKFAICVGDTDQCIWSDSVAADTATASDTSTLVSATSPSSDAAWTVFQVDSLLQTVKSHHITSGSMRVFTEWVWIYYNSGDMLPPLQFEVRAILKE